MVEGWYSRPYVPFHLRVRNWSVVEKIEGAHMVGVDKSEALAKGETDDAFVRARNIFTPVDKPTPSLFVHNTTILLLS